MEHRLRVTLHDGRSIVGTFLAFDKHLNLVLSEAEEFRMIKKSTSDRSAILEERTEKRSLGLVLIRGENVVSMAVEGPPPPSGKGVTAPSSTAAGPGMARGAGRGVLPSQQQQQAPHNAPPMMHPPPGYNPAPMGLGAAPVYGLGSGGLPPPPPPPPPPGGIPPPGMGRGMQYPPQF